MYTIQNAASKKTSQEHLLGRKMAGSESFGGKLMETFTTLSRSLEIFITPKFLSESRCSLFMWHSTPKARLYFICIQY